MSMSYKRADGVQMVCRFQLIPPKEDDLDACTLFIFLSKDYLDLKDFILFYVLKTFESYVLLNDERLTKSVFVSNV